MKQNSLTRALAALAATLATSAVLLVAGDMHLRLYSPSAAQLTVARA
jgi:hypothetical protein